MNDFDETESITSVRYRRRMERLAVLGVVGLLLAALAAPHGFHALAQRKADPVPLPPPLKPSPAGEFRGFSLQLHSNDPNIPFEQYVEEIAQTGANTIGLSLAAFQENASSSSLFVEYRKVPSLKRLEGLVRLARRRKLRVVMMPIVLLENPGPGDWRGRINPPKPDKWWADYESYILRYARVAETSGVEVFVVGSELVSLEDQTDRWRALIAKVRKVFSGILCYSANWDHYRDIEWWSDLDVVGMTSYHDLVGDKKPTLDVLRASFKPIKQKILAWQKEIGRPILFTEVGWPSQQGCAKEPWNYYGSKVPDVETQAKCFQAFFETWRQEKAVAGVLIWEWRNHPNQEGGPKDTSYIPRGKKPTMKAIQDYFRSPGAWDHRLPTTRPTTLPTTRPATLPASRPANP